MRNGLYKMMILCLISLLAMTGPVDVVRGQTSNALANYDDRSLLEEQQFQLAEQYDEEHTWIIKWNEEIDPNFTLTSEIIEDMPAFNAVVARPLHRSGADDIEAWIRSWEQSPAVDYIQLNHKIHISAKVDDPLYTSQSYLQQIKAEEAWDTMTENRDLIIAIVDTGVDLKHPDLKDNLVAGTNLIHPNRTPQDDNGHGTSLAGIIGASGNNATGITGILWRSRIMPIKALNAKGTGDENKLGQGIRYAVDNGAKIVLLSLGLYKYSPFMRDVVQYAEDNNVLLVAAAGNDGADVKYPAAYPTVLAVGGVGSSNQVVNDSNYGPELDVVAPWHVYSTMTDGEYGYNKGTSMAAPQVAAVAALIWAKYPHLKPYQIRDHIRDTAEKIGSDSWDSRAGYGLLRADLALSQGYNVRPKRNNTTRATATLFPVGSMLSVVVNGQNETNWFKLTAAYDGEITLKFTTDQQGALAQLQLVHYEGTANVGTTYSDIRDTITLNVKKGQSYIQIRGKSTAMNHAYSFRMSSEFHIYRDAFEDNDRQYKAYVLPPEIQTIVGTFHQLNDEDWFMLPIEQSGTLRLTASPNTNRMDLELLLFKQGERISPTDYTDIFGEGQTEYSRTINVLPGKYYVRIRNVISDQAYSVAGEYTLDVNYQKKYVDPNEPNDRAFQATTMGLAQNYKGVITEGDADWFSFRLEQSSYVTMALSDIPIDRMVTLSLLNNSQKQLSKDLNALGTRQLINKQVLAAGTYYIKLTANQSFDYQMYNFKVTAEQLVGGYRDIRNHWAKDDIVTLTHNGILDGYADSLFRPDSSITRAEAVKVIVNALNLSGTSAPLNFTDLNTNHWAYRDISFAFALGIIQGYPDGTFKPNQATNRVEMAAMIANALKLKISNTGGIPFTDIKENDWAIDLLRTMKADGWISGYPDGTFKPMQHASRAEFVTFISRAMP